VNLTNVCVRVPHLGDHVVNKNICIAFIILLNMTELQLKQYFQ